ncbi:hypothetical protein [Ochrobactrum teleogrylli]|uniref:hypothetical protein n=1 Tax=Ochrobactrum teleogrylli TaxID=2479765 RepID=UPI0035301CCC
MFREVFKSKRCLMPADGCYGCTKNTEDGGRDPWDIRLPEHSLLFSIRTFMSNGLIPLSQCHMPRNC